jgi:hypothetical protein
MPGKWKICAASLVLVTAFFDLRAEAVFRIFDGTFQGQPEGHWHNPADWNPDTFAISDDLMADRGRIWASADIISDGGGSITLHGGALYVEAYSFFVRIGDSGQATLDILSGADLHNGTGYIGSTAGS